jgi:drug/metabolite transporter (DMT)-like permease
MTGERRQRERSPVAVPAPSAALGVLFAALASSSFGLVITLAGVAYAGGANAGAVIELRFLVAVPVMAALLGATRGAFLPPPGVRKGVVLVALGNFGVTIGYLTSILFIPVSLGTVVFYTYPLLVAAIAPLLEHRRLGRLQQAAFVLAFVGLVLTLGPSFHGLDWRGVALAAFAAVSATYVFIASPRVVTAYNAVGMSLYVNVIGASLMLVAVLALGDFVLPQSPRGWAGLGGVSLFYIVASLSMFLALQAAGSVRTSLVFNLEPLVAIAAAAALLGERLSPLQIGGVALVIGALTLASLVRVRG